METIPYVQTENGPSIPDNVMAGLYQKMVDQGLHKVMFFDGDVKSTHDWLTLCKRPGNVMHTVWDGESIVLVAWLNAINRNYASAHYCFFKEYWSKGTDKIGRDTLGYWFNFARADGSPLFDVILGQTPGSNRPATIFLRKLGMKVLGTVPQIGYDSFKDKQVGMVFSYITREEFDNGRKK